MAFLISTKGVSCIIVGGTSLSRGGSDDNTQYSISELLVKFREGEYSASGRVA